MGVKQDKQRNTKERLILALEKTLGIITPACQLVGCCRASYQKYYQEDMDFRARVDELSEVQLDFVESKLLESIQNGSDAAIMFYLRTKGKGRGYGEKEIPETVDNTQRKLVVFGLRKRPETEVPPPSIHPVIITNL